MLLDHLRQQLADRDAQQQRRVLKVCQTSDGARMRVVTAAGQPARDLLAFCSNDYLGLAHHPDVVAAMGEGALRHGAGSGASHLVSGHSPAHALLEEELARWMAPCIPGARALFFGTGYLANLALLTALGDARATVFADKLNHASLVDGGLLARAEFVRYPHNRTDRLAQQLAACATPIKLIATDAVFSMDGDIAPLAELLRLAEAHDAWLVVDDAHGLGVLGPQGRGSLAQLGLRSERLICMGTLGKAVGVAGAFVAAHPVVVDALVNLARPYIYTTAAPPAVAHAALKSLALVEGPEGDSRRAHLQRLQARLRERLPPELAARGWRLAESTTAIQPLIVGDNGTALALSEALEQQGLWVPAIRPPTVPAGSARLRITLSAAHSEGDVDRLLAGLREAAMVVPLPPSPQPSPASGKGSESPSRLPSNQDSTPSPPDTGERAGGETGISSRMRRAHAATPACKPECALQVRGMAE
jgi:8-amino-7-oxononanoate synthase